MATLGNKKPGSRKRIKSRHKKLTMASTTLIVTVSGGTTPVSIVVNLFKSGQPVTSLIRTGTFKYKFTDLTKGNYTLFIGGVNPAGGNTKCELTQDEITLRPPDDSPITKKTVKYLVGFHFKVN